jgi:hypothetical protein
MPSRAQLHRRAAALTVVSGSHGLHAMRLPGRPSGSNQHRLQLPATAIIALHLQAGNSGMRKGHSSEEKGSLWQDQALAEVRGSCFEVDAGGERCQCRVPLVSTRACSLFGRRIKGSVGDTGATVHEGRTCTTSVAEVICTGAGWRAGRTFHARTKACGICGPTSRQLYGASGTDRSVSVQLLSASGSARITGSC